MAKYNKTLSKRLQRNKGKHVFYFYPTACLLKDHRRHKYSRDRLCVDSCLASGEGSFHSTLGRKSICLKLFDGLVYVFC